MAAAKKPDPAIFQYALEKASARAEESVFIGDDYEADVIGALEAGFSVMYFNPSGKVNPLNVPEIRFLSEISSILEKNTL